jgi:hypothetical protein
MKVKASQIGFYGGSRRRPGEVFEVPEGFKGKWFQPVQAEQEPAAPEAARRPRKAKVSDDAGPAPEAEQNADGLV